MATPFGRLARALLLAGGIATAIALPTLAGTPLLPSPGGMGASVVMAAPALDNDNDANNGDLGDDNSDERNLEGSVLEIHDDEDPPTALIGQVGGNVWARLYNNKLHESGMGVGDYVRLHGQYGDHGIFDAYEIDVVDRWDGDNGNDNG